MPVPKLVKNDFIPLWDLKAAFGLASVLDFLGETVLHKLAEESKNRIKNHFGPF
jgi:hypothetical protein